MTYASVVSRDTVRIALTLAALNDCEVLCADVQNAYLNAPPKEKVELIDKQNVPTRVNDILYAIEGNSQ